MTQNKGIARFGIINIGTLSMNKFWNETERVRSGTATCTLIETGGKRLIIDPSPTPELLKPQLLAFSGLRPDDIDMLFVTHFHADHRFGLDLFDGKPWLMYSEGLADWMGRSPNDVDLIKRFLPADNHLPEGIELFPSPGHTNGHCSLITKIKWGTLIITGDAVMTEEFFNAEEGFHNSVDFRQASETIRNIKESSDLVIPGHGNYFLNSD